MAGTSYRAAVAPPWQSRMLRPQPAPVNQANPYARVEVLMDRLPAAGPEGGPAQPGRNLSDVYSSPASGLPAADGLTDTTSGGTRMRLTPLANLRPTISQTIAATAGKAMKRA